MDLFLSTNWNAARHADGASMADEILGLGFAGVEVGYNLSERQAEGLRRRAADGALRVSSAHAYCPYPLGAPAGHPELYLLAAPDDDDRAMAVLLLQRTLDFAAEIGAATIVAHAGRIAVTPESQELIAAAEDDGADGARYLRLLARNQSRRARRARKHLDALRRSLDTLLPRCAERRLTLALENLPSWEAVPTEDEMLALLEQYPGAPLAYWHDLGHGQVRANLGWMNHLESARRLLPRTAGLHIHDVAPLSHDHLVPGDGKLPFADFAFYAASPALKVLEPAPGTPPDVVQAGAAYLRKVWS